MRQEVLVAFGRGHEVEIPVPTAAMAPDAARRWLDEQFLAHDCEPLRASGKVLTADKVLALATAAGPRRFADDAAFRDGFARATVAALGQAVVRVDVEAGAVTY